MKAIKEQGIESPKGLVERLEESHYAAGNIASKLFGLSALFEMDHIGIKSFDHNAMYGISDMLKALGKDAQRIDIALDKLVSEQRNSL